MLSLFCSRYSRRKLVCYFCNILFALRSSISSESFDISSRMSSNISLFSLSNPAEDFSLIFRLNNELILSAFLNPIVYFSLKLDLNCSSSSSSGNYFNQGSSLIFFISGLFRGSLLSKLSTRPLARGGNVFGKLISFRRIFSWISFNLCGLSTSFLSSKGVSPVRNSYINTPRLHMSTFSLYWTSEIISGGM